MKKNIITSSQYPSSMRGIQYLLFTMYFSKHCGVTTLLLCMLCHPVTCSMMSFNADHSQHTRKKSFEKLKETYAQSLTSFCILVYSLRSTNEASLLRPGGDSTRATYYSRGTPALIVWQINAAPRHREQVGIRRLFRKGGASLASTLLLFQISNI